MPGEGRGGLRLARHDHRFGLVRKVSLVGAKEPKVHGHIHAKCSASGDIAGTGIDASKEAIGKIRV